MQAEVSAGPPSGSPKGVVRAVSRKDPFERAVEFGGVARMEGQPRDANPYDDRRKADGRVTFSRAWRRAWNDGWDQMDVHVRTLQQEGRL